MRTSPITQILEFYALPKQQARILDDIPAIRRDPA